MDQIYVSNDLELFRPDPALPPPKFAIGDQVIDSRGFFREVCGVGWSNDPLSIPKVFLKGQCGYVREHGLTLHSKGNIAAPAIIDQTTVDCAHIPQLYTGLFESFNHCSKCGARL